MEEQLKEINLRLDMVIKMIKAIVNTNNNIEVDVRNMKREIVKIAKDIKELEK
jgi:hypothetical protein